MAERARNPNPGREPPRKRPKRFYKQAAAAPVEGGSEHAVLLDGRPVRSPGGAQLRVASAALAQAMADEWAAQGEEIVPESMPLTQLAFTALERVAPKRADVEANLAKYAETDLVCYRAGRPESLVDRQAAGWQPVVDWAATALGAPLRVTTGILPVEQPSESLANLLRAIEALDAHRLTVLASVTQASGSLLLGFALLRRYLDADAVADAAELDEAWQSELWGQDRESLQRRRVLREEIHAARRYLDRWEAG